MGPTLRASALVHAASAAELAASSAAMPDPESDELPPKPDQLRLLAENSGLDPRCAIGLGAATPIRDEGGTAAGGGRGLLTTGARPAEKSAMPLPASKIAFSFATATRRATPANETFRRMSAMTDSVSSGVLPCVPDARLRIRSLPSAN